jgi:hypothetical protein
MALEPAPLVTVPHEDGPEQTTAQVDPLHATSMPHEAWPEQRMSHLEALVQSTFAHAPSPHVTEHGMLLGHMTEAQLCAALQSMEHPPSMHVPPAAAHGPVQRSPVESTPASCGASLAVASPESTPESSPGWELPEQHTSAATAAPIHQPRKPSTFQSFARFTNVRTSRLLADRSSSAGQRVEDGLGVEAVDGWAALEVEGCLVGRRAQAHRSVRVLLDDLEGDG